MCCLILLETFHLIIILIPSNIYKNVTCGVQLVRSLSSHITTTNKWFDSCTAAVTRCVIQLVRVI